MTDKCKNQHCKDGMAWQDVPGEDGASAVHVAIPCPFCQPRPAQISEEKEP